MLYRLFIFHTAVAWQKTAARDDREKPVQRDENNEPIVDPDPDREAKLAVITEEVEKDLRVRKDEQVKR